MLVLEQCFRCPENFNFTQVFLNTPYSRTWLTNRCILKLPPTMTYSHKLNLGLAGHSLIARYTCNWAHARWLMSFNYRSMRNRKLCIESKLPCLFLLLQTDIYRIYQLSAWWQTIYIWRIFNSIFVAYLHAWLCFYEVWITTRDGVKHLETSWFTCALMLSPSQQSHCDVTHSSTSFHNTAVFLWNLLTELVVVPNMEPWR